MSGVLWFLAYLAAGVLVMRGLHMAYYRWHQRRWQRSPIDDETYRFAVFAALCIWPIALVVVAVVIVCQLMVAFIVRPVKHRGGAR
jgi:hypothetical protein